MGFSTTTQRNAGPSLKYGHSLEQKPNQTCNVNNHPTDPTNPRGATHTDAKRPYG